MQKLTTKIRRFGAYVSVWVVEGSQGLSCGSQPKTGSSYIVHWMNHGTEFTTTTVPSVTYTKGAGTDTITARVVSTATYGCYDSTTSTGHVVTVEPLGIASPRPSPKEREVLQVYPNPVSDVLYIDISIAAHYRLTDAVGSVVGEGVLGVGNNWISMKNIQKGIYLLETTEPLQGGKMTSKIIKE